MIISEGVFTYHNAKVNLIRYTLLFSQPIAISYVYLFLVYIEAPILTSFASFIEADVIDLMKFK